MGDYNILRGRLLGEKVALETYINIVPHCPGPTHRIKPRPAHSQIFFRVIILKKLDRTAYNFNRGLGPRVKAFLLRTNIDLKNRSFKTVDQKNFKYRSGSYRPKAYAFLLPFFRDNAPLSFAYKDLILIFFCLVFNFLNF
jgi:hypothetical protein